MADAAACPRPAVHRTSSSHAARTAGWAGELARCAPGHPGADRGRDPLGRRRGRRPPARRPRDAAAGRRARSVHRAGQRPAGRSAGPVRAHPRPVHRRRGRRSASAWARRWWTAPCTASPRPDGWSQGEFRPGGADGTAEWCDAEVLRRLRRRSLAGPAAGGRAGAARPRSAPSSRSGSTSGHDGQSARCRRPAACRRAACRARPFPRPPGDVSCSPPGWPATTPRCSTTDRRPARSLWAGAGPCPARTAGSRSTWPTTPRCRCHRPPPLELSARPPGGPRRLSGGYGLFFRQLADQVRARHGDGRPSRAIADALWDLAWSGRLTNDTLAPLRALLGSGRTAGSTATAPARRRPGAAYGALAGRRPAAARGRSADDRRPLVAAARRRNRPDPARARARPTPCSTGTASSPAGAVARRGCRGRLLRGLPRAVGVRGVRTGPPRLRRGGARRGPVRAWTAPSTGCAPCTPRGERADARTASAPRAVVLAAADPANAVRRRPALARAARSADTRPATNPAARRAPWSSSSTARSPSTSSAAARPSWPGPGRHTASADGRRSTRRRGPRRRPRPSDRRAYQRRGRSHLTAGRGPGGRRFPPHATGAAAAGVSLPGRRARGMMDPCRKATRSG